MTPLDLLWLFFILSSLQPLIQQRILAARRTHAIHALERRNTSRVITLIHRRESFSFLGIPFGGVIDIDVDQVLRDPAHPTRLLPAYDSGDHLHPNAAGGRAIADAIDLKIFR